MFLIFPALLYIYIRNRGVKTGNINPCLRTTVEESESQSETAATEETKVQKPDENKTPRTTKFELSLQESETLDIIKVDNHERQQAVDGKISKCKQCSKSHKHSSKKNECSKINNRQIDGKDNDYANKNNDLHVDKKMMNQDELIDETIANTKAALASSYTTSLYPGMTSVDMFTPKDEHPDTLDTCPVCLKSN